MKSKTRINEITGTWKNIKNKCRTTVNKDYSEIEPTRSFKRNLLISEHSPIRLLNIDWSWKGIEYWLSTEWSRHKFEKFISTQRTDRTGVERGERPQNTLVNFDGMANAQNLIDAWRKRLCGSATKEAQILARDFKIELHVVEPELAEMLVPHCIYRSGCSEFPNGTCKVWENFRKKHPDIDLGDIRERYDAYNLDFFKYEN